MYLIKCKTKTNTTNKARGRIDKFNKKYGVESK